MFTTGQQIGVYTLIRMLGKGGFGEVWLAERQSQFLTKRVAIKLPLDEQVDFETIKHEAQLWEQASGHPNVLPIIDADVYDGQVVIVSEYAEDGSLADKLAKEGKFPVQKAIGMCIGILKGLDFLHTRKIIHRDIKPQNILLQGDTPRLADFGISRAMNTTIVSSIVVGTDAYMAPEAFDGKRNVQTDIWSVGVVLYQLLKNDLPFPQQHPSERMFAVLTKDFEPLPPDTPEVLQRIVARALSKQSENRYQSAVEMRDDLQKAFISLNQPSAARTEVFQNAETNKPNVPPPNIPHGTAPGESVVTQTPNQYIPPTEAAFGFQSGAQNPYQPNNPFPPGATNFVINNPPKKSKGLLFAPLILGTALGIVVVGVIAAYKLSAPPIVSNTNTNFSPTRTPTSTPSASRTATPTSTPTPTPSPSPTSEGKTEKEEYACLLNSGDSINIRRDCDVYDCEEVDTRVRTYPHKEPVYVLGGGAKRSRNYKWVKIKVISTGQIGWVADSKIGDCDD